MIDLIINYWYFYVIFFILLAIAVWAGRKAAKAAKKRNETMRKYNEEMQRFRSLAEKYENISPEEAKLADSKELCEGITAVLQIQLEHSDDPDNAFKSAPSWKKEVYALCYFGEDTEESLSFFFRHNEYPLPEVALSGLKSIDNKMVSAAASMHAMYDDKNESVSLDKDRAQALDTKFKAEFNRAEFYEEVKIYIVNNM